MSEHAEQPEQDDVDAVRTEVERIIAIESETAYQDALESFLSTRKTQWRRIANHLCHSNSVQRSRYLEEVEAIVVEVAWEMVEKSRREPTYLATMRSFMAIVVFNARPKVRSHIDHATAPASGMVGAQRRQRELKRTRSELAAARGQMPSVAETVRVTNERMAATRKDPVRQGMVVSEEDERAFRGALPFDETLDSDRHVDLSDTFILHPAEGPVLVRTVVEMAKATDEMCGRVAELWMGEAYSTGGPPPGQDTVSWIARQLGLTRARTNTYVGQVRGLAVQYLATMGITGLDVA